MWISIHKKQNIPFLACDKQMSMTGTFLCEGYNFREVLIQLVWSFWRLQFGGCSVGLTGVSIFLSIPYLSVRVGQRTETPLCNLPQSELYRMRSSDITSLTYHPGYHRCLSPTARTHWHPRARAEDSAWQHPYSCGWWTPRTASLRGEQIRQCKRLDMCSCIYILFKKMAIWPS